MAVDHSARRADFYRRHANELAETAERQHDEALRRHMLDLAATYQRAADQMAPQPHGVDLA